MIVVFVVAVVPHDASASQSSVVCEIHAFQNIAFAAFLFCYFAAFILYTIHYVVVILIIIIMIIFIIITLLVFCWYYIFDDSYKDFSILLNTQLVYNLVNLLQFLLTLCALK